ncbi:MAG: hypothetical protein GWN14_00300, partial [candidate division Zixibacteria bacterium]|nr:hypothetical protein [Gammaproteobacteria bacterium]NIX54401.1 hypothetical protein [candidate division Zixibacteria bacterium]
EFITIIKDIEKKTGGFAAIIGHSLGGMAALLAVKRGVTAKKVVTINTPVSIDFIFDSFAAQLGASSKSIAYISRFLENMTQMPIDEFTADKLVSNMQVPGMIIHDRDDKEIPVDQAYSLHQGWDKSTLTLTRQLGHRRILHDQDTISNIIRNLSILEKQEALRVPLAE